jgi:hypothetical protein
MYTGKYPHFVCEYKGDIIYTNKMYYKPSCKYFINGSDKCVFLENKSHMKDYYHSYSQTCCEICNIENVHMRQFLDDENENDDDNIDMTVCDLCYPIRCVRCDILLTRFTHYPSIFNEDIRLCKMCLGKETCPKWKSVSVDSLYSLNSLDSLDSLDNC